MVEFRLPNFGHGGDYNPDQWLDRPDILKQDIEYMKEAGITPLVALGFRSAKDTFYLDEFKTLGCELLIATEDGSMGMKGFVTDLVKSAPERDYILTCGPLPMLKALHALPQLKDGQFSFEARMGCGFGACVGCTVPTKDGYKRVCKDGPILFKEEIVW